MTELSDLRFEPFQGPGLDLMVIRGHSGHESGWAKGW